MESEIEEIPEVEQVGADEEVSFFTEQREIELKECEFCAEILDLKENFTCSHEYCR